MAKIVIIGFMGSGKSTVAKRLGEILGAPVREMDDRVVARSGLASIRDIFEKHGEPFFRDLESQEAQALAEERTAVVSTGGGVIGRAGNMERLRANGGVVVFLRASFATVKERNAGLETRPLFRDGAKAAELFEARAPLYQHWADITVDTDGKLPEDVCAEILSRLTFRNEVTARSSVCLVIGDPISHSRSPSMHNAAYAALGLPFIMAAAHVRAPELQEAVRGMRALNIRGLSVTMPHKTAILPFLDELDALARKVGAVNTVVNVDGRLTGFNTDVAGIVEPLERRSPLAGKKIALLGSGGAAQAAAHGCASRGASVTIFNRTAEKAQALAEACGGSACVVGSSPDLSQFDIIINATSVGMGDQAGESPLPETAIEPHHTVFETIYHPSSTELVKIAERRGATVIRGLEMFLEQGLAQFHIQTGVKGPREVMESVLKSSSGS